MANFRFPTITEQVADHLRGELERGRWSGLMPGKHELAAELGVNNKTVESALRQLEAEKLLLPQGAGKRRKILMVLPERHRMLRISILCGEPSDLGVDYLIELRHRLQDQGHSVRIAQSTLADLNDDPKRLAAMVRDSDANTWVVWSGSRKVLEWFAARPEPAFAVFGRRSGLPLASVGPDKTSAIAEAARALVGLGHRRIVFMVRPRRRLPQPGRTEMAFLNELEARGLEVGNYNLPAWDETPEGFHKCLAQLFRVTPPTAMIIDEAPLFFATQHFLSSKGLSVPRDVSLIATDPDSAFHWCQPSVAHIQWESGPIVRRVLNWTANIRRGLADRRQSLTKAVFVTGGTIGPVGIR